MRTVTGRHLADPVLVGQSHAEHMQRLYGAQGQTHDERLPHLRTVERWVRPPLRKEWNDMSTMPSPQYWQLIPRDNVTDQGVHEPQ